MATKKKRRSPRTYKKIPAADLAAVCRLQQEDAHAIREHAQLLDAQAQALAGLRSRTNEMLNLLGKLMSSTGGLWTQRNGRVVQIRQMDDNHIERAKQMVAGKPECADYTTLLTAEQERRKEVAAYRRRPDSAPLTIDTQGGLLLNEIERLFNGITQHVSTFGKSLLSELRSTVFVALTKALAK